MGAVAVIMMAGGAVSGAYGAYNKSKLDRAAYGYQAKIDENNAQYGEWQAADAIARGQVAENQSRQRTAQLKGTQRATLAARGVALDEGSALNILSDTDFMGDLDALAIRDNAAREAWAYREKAKGNNADAILMRARGASESPGAAATSSLLTSAGGVASAWYSYKKPTSASTS